jgi:hypothetical protein
MALTEKIELARKLPGQILKEAKIPVEGLTVKNGIPLVKRIAAEQPVRRGKA